MVFTAQTLRDSAVRPKRRHRTTPPTAVLSEDPRKDTTTFNRPWLKSQWPGGEDRNGTRSRSDHGNRCSDRISRSRKPRLEAPAKVTVARGTAQQSKEHAPLVARNRAPRGACPDSPRTTRPVKHGHRAALKNKSNPATPACGITSRASIAGPTFFTSAILFFNTIPIIF